MVKMKFLEMSPGVSIRLVSWSRVYGVKLSQILFQGLFPSSNKSNVGYCEIL